jgi:hypothetical protein
MGTDVRFVVDQFALCNRFASLGVANPDNTLLPQAYGRVQTAYLKQNRKEAFNVAYGDENKSYTFPESLRALQAAYLRVNLPNNGSGDYKMMPGLHIIKTVHIRCNGDLVYSTPYRSIMSDHLASLRDESARAYAAAHLGYIAGAASGVGRVCWLPIPLPNSSIWRYGGRSQGALPFSSFKNNKIEVTFDLYDDTYSAADRSTPSPALSGGQIIMKEVVAPLSQMPVLSDARGRYSIVSRRFTILQDFAVVAANTEADIVVSNLSGCVTELIVEAFVHDANIDRLDIRSPVVPKSVRLICDSVECIKYDTQDECRLVEYSHGYRRNDFYSGNVYRLVFGSHGADTDRQFCGAMNFQGITQANLKLVFPGQTSFRVIAVQLGVTSITSSGRLVQKLD